MYYLFWYFIIGLVLMFLAEVFIHTYSNQIASIDNGEVPKFDWFTRIFTILLWPFQIAYIIYGLFD
ncbi:MAG: hypothetical protein CL827_09845 [Crocinitomicaceae bacterium]|nr:hypothetical protein [Crocinitomicaceae bacterium]